MLRTKITTKLLYLRFRIQYLLINAFAISIIPFFGLLSLVLIYFMYQDIKSQENLSTYCYAFSAANVLCANLMFGLGRSNVFLERFPEKKDQLLIYKAGILFTSSALLGLAMSAFNYFESSNYPKGTKLSSTTLTAIYISTSLYLSVAIFLTIWAMYNFGSWIRKEIKLSKTNSKNEIEK